jgi:PAS domain S-box-containing protein
MEQQTSAPSVKQMHLNTNHHSTEALEVLLSVSRTLNQSLDLDTILNDALDRILEIFQCHSVHIRIKNHKNKKFFLAAQRGLRTEDLAILLKKNIEEGIVNQALTTGEALIIEDIDDDPRYGNRKGFVRMIGCRSLFYLPMITKGNFLGTLSMRYRNPHSYKIEEVQLLSSIGHLLATAVENAQLYKEKEMASRRLSNILDSADALIYVTDINTGEVLFANDYGKKIWGNIEGTICWQSIENNQAGPCQHCMAGTLNSAERNPTGLHIYQFQNTINQQWYDCHARSIQWMDGRIVRIAIAINVDDRKKNEEKLRESEEKYRSLASTADRMYLVDRDCRYLIANEKYLETRGFTMEQIAGKRYDEINGEETSKSFAASFTKVLKTKSSYQAEYVSPDGKVSIRTFSPVKNKEGEIVAVTVVGKDISELKRLEMELKATNDNLESIVQQRTTELKEINTTLRVLIKKREEHQRELEESLQSNIQQLVFPTLNKLRMAAKSNKQNLSYVNVLETNLMNIVSPFINKLLDKHKCLTPKEIQIVELIRQGRSSKEIADFLCLSIGTVLVHRNNIRKKLNLRSKNINLTTYLLSYS